MGIRKRHYNLAFAKTEKIKISIIMVLLINSVFIFGQELEKDTAWIESESKALFSAADELTSIVYNHLELDYLIENLDTLTEKGKIKKEVYLEQKEDLLKRALNNYEQLTSNYPTSSLYHMALNNRGIIEYEFKMYENAKKSFIELLNSDVDDKEEVSVGYGLMAEPFANYRNRAAEMLYEIEFAQGNYIEAKRYLEESTKHKYHYWCGNANEEKEFWLAHQSSKIESKLGNFEDARRLMIPYIFNRQIRKDQELAQYWLELLLRVKTMEELIDEFEKGIRNYYTKKRRPDSDYIDYYIKFLGEELKVDIYTPENKDEEPKVIKDKVENQWIYYLIKSGK